MTLKVAVKSFSTPKERVQRAMKLSVRQGLAAPQPPPGAGPPLPQLKASGTL